MSRQNFEGSFDRYHDVFIDGSWLKSDKPGATAVHGVHWGHDNPQ